MTSCLLNYFTEDENLKSTCDFNPYLIEEGLVVYEVIKVVNQIPLFLEDHLDRFFRSLQLVKAEKPPVEFIKTSLFQLIESNRMRNGNIRFQVSQSGDQRSKWHAWVSPHFYPTQKQYQEGVDIGIFDFVRKNPEVKQWDISFKHEIDKYLTENRFHETLLVNHEGMITEGSRSNVFFIKNETVFTCPAENALVGITRKKVIEIITNMNIVLKEEMVSVRELSDIEAAFISGTSPGVLPIKTIDHELHFKADHQLITKIRSGYESMCQTYLEQFVW